MTKHSSRQNNCQGVSQIANQPETANRAIEVLNPDNLVATPDDKMKAWLYLKEYLAIMLNE